MCYGLVIIIYGSLFNMRMESFFSLYRDGVIFFYLLLLLLLSLPPDVIQIILYDFILTSRETCLFLPSLLSSLIQVCISCLVGSTTNTIIQRRIQRMNVCHVLHTDDKIRSKFPVKARFRNYECFQAIEVIWNVQGKPSNSGAKNFLAERFRVWAAIVQYGNHLRFIFCRQ